MDLNLRPAAYKAAALPTELWGTGASSSNIHLLTGSQGVIAEDLTISPSPICQYITAD